VLLLYVGIERVSMNIACVYTIFYLRNIPWMFISARVPLLGHTPRDDEAGMRM
jgi:hypothetical protein